MMWLRFGNTERLKVDIHGVYPEVAAQLHGFVHSNRFDRARPKIMLIDIGGGTVDCTVANITEDDDGLPVINTLATNVQPLGVNSLSQYRLKWLRKSAHSAELMELVSQIDTALPLSGSRRLYRSRSRITSTESEPRLGY